MSRFMQKLACRFHADAELLEDSRAGDMICSQCGLVVAERLIDVSSEWRTFADDDSGKAVGRVGAAQNLLFDQVNLDTSTAFSPKSDLNGRQKPQGQSSTTTDRALREGYQEIRQICSRVNLPKKVIDRAFLVFKECYTNKFVRGRARNTIIAVCIYIACRKEGSGRTIQEICNLTYVYPVDFGRCFSEMKQHTLEPNVGPRVTMKDIIPRFCNQLNLKNPRLVQKTALHIADNADKFCDLEGRKPASIASAVIFLACQACGEQITKKNIREVTTASEVVIRDICKLMTPSLQKLFPDDFVFQRSLDRKSVV